MIFARGEVAPPVGKEVMPRSFCVWLWFAKLSDHAEKLGSKNRRTNPSKHREDRKILIITTNHSINSAADTFVMRTRTP